TEEEPPTVIIGVVLRRLTVRNLAIVEDLDLELGPGLTVVTGETGAGKSILVDALALLAGGRGASDLVRQGADRLVVAGEFDCDRPLRDLVVEAGLPADGETLLVRRELSSDGRGRAFVEDEPAAVRTLARLGERLVSIQGQSSEKELVDPEAPLELLDAFAGAGPERERVERAAAEWANAIEIREKLEASGRDRSARLDLVEFQIREIESVSPDEKEEEELTYERERLRHADRVRRAGEGALEALSEGDSSAADRLGEASRAFAELAAIDPRESGRLEELEDLKRRIADLAAAARDAASGIEADPDRLTSVESRLEKLSRLKQKYGPTLADARALLAKLVIERAELGNIEDALERREREERAAREAYRSAATALSARRQGAAPRFSAAVQKELGGLALEKARFRVALTKVGDAGPRRMGFDRASFLFQPNPGEAERPIERIASGGELSRLQLAVHSVGAARSGRRRTLVFDEVDAGIGGRTAESVGRKLRGLAERDQVLCVTHVPQIAALADRHFRAEKTEARGRTIATVRVLEGKERVAEIARMIAGEKVPETAMRHARELLSQAGNA
ncbi:MAG TPA: DNA repair protein RecN, partial [Thermoanaerobaculia bacterium]|nr:DNA repair protein RecN [Thermoanaerobaculia bacterium]